MPRTNDSTPLRLPSPTFADSSSLDSSSSNSVTDTKELEPMEREWREVSEKAVRERRESEPMSREVMEEVREEGSEVMELRELEPIVTFDSKLNTVEPTITSVREPQLALPMSILSNDANPVIFTFDALFNAFDSTSIDSQFTKGVKSMIPSQSKSPEMIS